MDLIFLGTGSSFGSPLVGGFTTGADASNPKNFRTRSSVLVKAPAGNILIDVSPEIRMQSINNKVDKIDAILLSHGHIDHIGGLWEMPRYAHIIEKNINVFCSQETMDFVKMRFDFMFKEETYFNAKGKLVWNIIKEKEKFNCCGLEITPIFFPHNGRNKKITATGYMFDNTLYSTDASGIFQENSEYLYNLKNWIIDCNNGETTKDNGHLNLEQVLELKEQFKPEQTVLTHLEDNIDYDKFNKVLPQNVIAAYDGMIIEL